MRLLLLCTLLTLSAPLAFAQRGDSLVYHARNGQTAVALSAPIDATLTMDGKLDEPVWQSAARLTGFSMYRPVDQQAAPDSTEILVWYSAAALHIGVRAFEPHGAVRATLADRDRVSSDDHVEIHLDTFDERRRAFVFIVNALGIQADGTKAEGGGFIPGSNVAPGQNDLSPDFQWQSRGQITDYGYEVELRIPFSSLRFPARGVQRWGFQVIRHVQHSGYQQTWTPVRLGAASFIGQAGSLEGLRDMRHGLDVTLNPELTTSVAGVPAPVGSDQSWQYTNTPLLGGNIRAGLGSNFVLNGAIRPDFSQVEADALQVAADPRFALFYPERRPFFVEGSDQFNVPNTLVYTRRIVQPDAALKLTGRVGRGNISLLSAIEAPVAGSNDSRPIANIVRLTRDFAEQSQAGLLYSERVGGGSANRVIGADMRHVFGGMYFLQLQSATAITRAAGRTQTGSLWEATVDRTGRSWGFNYKLLGIQPEFRADNGFVARTGYVQPALNNRITIFGTPGKLFERYNVFIGTSGLWRYDDFFASRRVLETRFSANNQVTFRRGWSVSFTPSYSGYAFDPAAFANLATGNGTATPDAFVPARQLNATSLAFSVSTPQFRRFFASAGVTQARDVDFAETAPVDRTAVTAELTLRPTERLRANATYASNEFVRTVDGLSSFSTRIPRLRVEYQLSRFVFVRVVSQYEANRREPLRDYRTGLALLERQSNGTYVPSVRRSSNVLRTDWLFSYRPRPGTTIFAGYGSSLTEPDALAFSSLRRASDGIFLKASVFLQRKALQ
jgi:hypothetical protein